jgi:hypothetical protein
MHAMEMDGNMIEVVPSHTATEMHSCTTYLGGVGFLRAFGQAFYAPLRPRLAQFTCSRPNRPPSITSQVAQTSVILSDVGKTIQH